MVAELFHTVIRGYDKDEVLTYLDKLISIHEEKEDELKNQLDKSFEEQKRLEREQAEAVQKYNETAQQHDALLEQSHRVCQTAESLSRQLAEAHEEIEVLHSLLGSDTDNTDLRREAARQFEAVVTEAQKKASKIVADAIIESEAAKGRVEKSLSELGVAKEETAAFLTQAKRIFGEGVDNLLARLDLFPMNEAGADEQDADVI